MDIPKSLAHYEVSSLLGQGGMGEVVRARDTRLGREVALKLLPVEFLDDPERQARFEREARLLAQLQHPNVASVYGLEQAAGRLFLVMELVEGEDLAQRIGRGALPVEEAVAIAAQIAAGLEEAHERGIVHRDLKPGNVMLTPTGDVKILDFGLARAFLGDGTGDEDMSNSPTITAAMTGAGTILGTAAYMAPEQARGKPVDRRADIWALGVILYEMLTGRRLFAGETISDTLAAVLRLEVDLATLPAGTPPAVRRLLARCLDRDPKRRLRDAGEARIALEDPAALDAAQAPTAAPAGRTRPLLWAAVAVVVGLAAAGGAWLLKPVPEPPLRKLELSTGPGRIMNARESGVAISPDGQWIAYSSLGTLWIRRLDDFAAHEVEGSKDVSLIFWSPDSEWVGFALDTIVWKVPASGGQPLRVGELPSRPGLASGAAWLEDGHIYVTTGDAGIFALPAAGGRCEEVVTRDLEKEQDLHNASPLPGGGVLYVRHNLDGINALGVWRDGVRKQVLYLPGEYLKHPFYAPSGYILFCEGESTSGLWAVPFDVDRLETRGEPFFIAPEADLPTVSADGTLVYLSGGGANVGEELALVDRQGATLKVLGRLPSIWPYPSLGPDRDVAACAARESINWDLWLCDERGGRVRLTDDVPDDDCPVISSNGRWVYFCKGNQSDWNLMRRAVDGTGDPDTLIHGGDLPPDYMVARPWLTADDRLLLYGAKGVDGKPDIAMLTLGEDGLPSGPPETVIATKAAEMGAVLSPDGQFLAYMSDLSGRVEVYVARFPSGAGRRQVSVSGGTWPRWRSDGRELCYVAVDSLAAVDIETGDRLHIGAPRVLFSFPGTNKSLPAGQTDGFDMTPDAQAFLMVRLHRDPDKIITPAHVVVVENWAREFR